MERGEMRLCGQRFEIERQVQLAVDGFEHAVHAAPVFGAAIGRGHAAHLLDVLGVTIDQALQVFGLKAGVLRDAGEHARAKLFAVVKGEYKIGPTLTT